MAFHCINDFINKPYPTQQILTIAVLYVCLFSGILFLIIYKLKN